MDDPAGDDPQPLPPVRPSPADCCGGGCTRCVFDLHDAAMDRYHARLEAWRMRRAAESNRHRG